MSEFDPDKYIASKVAAPTFDPDAYLSKIQPDDTTQPPATTDTTVGEPEPPIGEQGAPPATPAQDDANTDVDKMRAYVRGAKPSLPSNFDVGSTDAAPTQFEGSGAQKTSPKNIGAMTALGIPSPEGGDIASSALRAGYNAVEGMTTLQNIGILAGLPQASPFVQRAIGGYFVKPMMDATRESLVQYHRAKTIGQRVEAAIGAVLSAAMTVGAAAGTSHPMTDTTPKVAASRRTTVTPKTLLESGAAESAKRELIKMPDEAFNAISGNPQLWKTLPEDARRVVADEIARRNDLKSKSTPTTTPTESAPAPSATQPIPPSSEGASAPVEPTGTSSLFKQAQREAAGPIISPSAPLEVAIAKTPDVAPASTEAAKQAADVLRKLTEEAQAKIDAEPTTQPERKVTTNGEKETHAQEDEGRKKEKLLNPNDLVPALKIGDQVVEGRLNDSHNDIFNRYVAEHGKDGPEFEQAVTALADDDAHVFKAGDKTLSRDEAATALGLTEPLHSEKLRKLQKPPSAPVAETPTGAPPEETQPPAVAEAPDLDTIKKDSKAWEEIAGMKKPSNRPPIPESAAAITPGTIVRSNVYRGEGDITITGPAEVRGSDIVYPAHFSGTSRSGHIQAKHFDEIVSRPSEPPSAPVPPTPEDVTSVAATAAPGAETPAPKVPGYAQRFEGIPVLEIPSWVEKGSSLETKLKKARTADIATATVDIAPEWKSLKPKQRQELLQRGWTVTEPRELGKIMLGAHSEAKATLSYRSAQVPKRTFKRKIPEAPGGSDAIERLLGEVGKITHPETARHAALHREGKSAGEVTTGRAGEYDPFTDLPSGLRHLIFYRVRRAKGETQGGIGPAKAAQGAQEAGIIKGDSPDELAQALRDAWTTRLSHEKAQKTAAAEQAKAEATSNAQDAAFAKESKVKAPGDVKLHAGIEGSLDIGDKIEVNGETMKVTDMDADGNVTLEDGSRYGLQHVEGGDFVYGEIVEKAPVDEDPDWPELDKTVDTHEKAAEIGASEKLVTNEVAAPDVSGTNEPVEEAHGQGQAGAASVAGEGEVGYQPPERPEILKRGPLGVPKERRGEYDAAKSAYQDALAKWVESVPANKAIIFTSEVGGGRPRYSAVTRDPSGDWRITHFDAELEMPYSHEVFKTRLEAVKELSTWERIDRLPFTVKAGEFHAQRTPYLWLKEEGKEPRMVKFGGYAKGGETAAVIDASKVYTSEWETVKADDLSRPTKEEGSSAMASEKEQFRQHNEQRIAEVAALRKQVERTGIVEIEGGDVRIKPSEAQDGKYDLVKTVNGKREIISNPENPGSLEEMQDGAASAAHRFGARPKATPKSLPQLREGKSSDDLLQGDNDVFNLVSETAADKAARLKHEHAEEAAKAAKDSAEAKALQDKQQLDIFAENAPVAISPEAKSLLDRVPKDISNFVGNHDALKEVLSFTGKPLTRVEGERFIVTVIPSDSGSGKGIEVVESKQKPGFPVVTGRWMDQWEPYMQKKFGVSEADYEKLPVERRAEIEATQQRDEYLEGKRRNWFADSFARTYHPEEWEKWMNENRRPAKEDPTFMEKPYGDAKTIKHWEDRFFSETPKLTTSERDKLHTDAYSVADGIANKVASGQPDSVREAAFDAAYKNAASSIDSGGKFNPDFMRKSAMEAAGKEAAKLGTSLDEPVGGEGETTAKDQLASNEQSPSDQAQAKDAEQIAQEETDKLPENERRIIEETAAGTPDDVIAESLGMTVPSVRTIRSRVRKKLSDRITARLDKILDATKFDPTKLHFDPLLIQTIGKPALRAALQIIRAANEAGKPALDAIEEGILYLRDNAAKWSDDIEKMVRAFFAPVKESESQRPKPPSSLPKKPSAPPESAPQAAPGPQPAGSPESSGPVSSEQPSTGGPIIQLRKSFTDAERERMGIPPWIDPNAITNPEAWEHAQRVLAANPDAATPLIREALTHPRALEPYEKAIILSEQVKRNREFVAAVDAKNAATTPGEILSAQMRLDAARDANQEIFDVDRAVGRASGQSLQAHKMGFDTETQTLARMEAVIQSSLKPGDKLSNHPKLEAEIADLHKQLEAERAKSAAAEAAAKETDVAGLMDQILSSIKEAKKSKKAGETLVDFGKKLEESARQRLRARNAGKLFSGLNPVDLIDHAQIGASWIIQGIGNLAKFTDKLVSTYGEKARPHAEEIYDASKKQAEIVKGSYNSTRRTKSDATPKEVLGSIPKDAPLKSSDIYDLVRAHIAENPDVKLDKPTIAEIMDSVAEELQDKQPGITGDEVRDAFSGYGKEHKPLSKEQLNVKMRELHAASGVVSKLQRALNGEEVKKIGPQRDRPTPLVRELTKELVRAMRANGIDTRTAEGMLKTAHDARVTRLKNAIEDTQRQIEQGKRTPKTPGVEWTAEETALKDQLNEIKSKLDDMLNEPDSDELSRTMDRIETVTDKLNTGKIAPKAKSQNVPTQALAEAREKLSALNTELAKRRKAQRDLENPPKTEDEKKLASLEKQEETLAEQIRTGKIEPTPGKPTADTQQVAEARARVEALRTQISDLRKAKRLRDNPPKTDAEKYLAALEKRNQDARDLLNSGSLYRKPGKPAPSSPEIDAARAELHETNRLLAEARKNSATGRQRALDAYQKAIGRKSAELRDKIARGDFSKPPKRTTDTEKTKLAVPYKLLQEKWAMLKRREELKNQSALQKTLRWTTYLAHEMLLLGSHVGQKLATAAATTASIVRPLEEVAGYALGKAVPALGEKADVEIATSAGSLVRHEAAAAADAFLRVVDDIGSTLKHGKADFELEFGKHYDSAMVSYVGRLHAVLKTIPARQAFTATFIRLSEKYAARGLDITNPDVRQSIGEQSLLKALEAKFQDPNLAVQAFKSALRTVEQKSPNVGAVTTAVARTEMPVMTVASNITWRAFESVYGVPVSSARIGWKAVTNMLHNTFGKKGADFVVRTMQDFTPEQAESIAKQFKRGSVGVAAFLIGAYAYKNLGGFYQEGKKRDPGAVKPEEIRIGSLDIPKDLIHHPIFTAMQAGAATMQVAESKLHKDDEEPQGKAQGALSAGISVAENSPFGGAVKSVSKLFNPYTRLDAEGQYARTMLGISGPVAWLAKNPVPFTNIGGDVDGGGEVVKRRARTFGEELKLGLPGLRKTVPEQKLKSSGNERPYTPYRPQRRYHASTQ